MYAINDAELLKQLDSAVHAGTIDTSCAKFINLSDGQRAMLVEGGKNTGSDVCDAVAMFAQGAIER
jgi:hypothetical protein